MKTSVVSKEYRELNEAIINLQEQWKNNVPKDSVQPKIDIAALEAGVPVVALTNIHFNITLFVQWIGEITDLLIDSNATLSGKLANLKSILSEEVAQRWIDEAIACNQVYFTTFAGENNLEEWIPQFLAETAVRPYLQLVAESVQDHIDHATKGAGCPVCGEPARVATLEGKEGKKVLHCPRCLFSWKAKRLECAHCGNEDHKTIKFLSIEGDAATQIQVCEECNGYIKVIDTRQYINKPQAAILDLNTIHLDFVAQENGYSAVGEKKETN